MYKSLIGFIVFNLSIMVGSLYLLHTPKYQFSMGGKVHAAAVKARIETQLLFDPAPFYGDTLYLIGPIDIQTTIGMIKALRQVPDNFNLFLTINSPGGSLYLGSEIIKEINKAKQRGVTLQCTGDYMVASMAAIIALECNTFYMAPMTMLMHHSITFCMNVVGCFTEQDMIDNPTLFDSSWNFIYTEIHNINVDIAEKIYKRSNQALDVNDILQHMHSNDWYMTCPQAQDLGLAEGCLDVSREKI